MSCVPTRSIALFSPRQTMLGRIHATKTTPLSSVLSHSPVASASKSLGYFHRHRKKCRKRNCYFLGRIYVLPTLNSFLALISFIRWRISKARAASERSTCEMLGKRTDGSPLTMSSIKIGALFLLRFSHWNRKMISSSPIEKILYSKVY